MWILLCLALAVVESGDWSAILRAQQLFHEVYGKRIESAKTAQEKSALAREILQVAREEPDATNKYVGLMQARQLAVEAQDGAVALEVVQALVTSFADEQDSDTNGLLHRAEMLWELAEKKRGPDQLSGRLDAVELYLRAGVTSPFAKKKWELRIEQIKSGGAIVLRAKDAKVHAGRAAYASQFDAICYWKDPSEWFEWETSIPSARYRLEVDYAAMGAGAASEFGVAFFRVNARKPSAVLSFSLQSTGNWREFRNRVAGIVVVPHDGEYRVEFRVLRPRSQEGFINLRSVRLVPLD